MINPCASILINNHNYGRYLAAAIDSALAQSAADVQVVAVDDGSSDESPSILKRYRDRIETILVPHRGQAAALNAGFTRARGPVVIFLDADDVLEPWAVSRVLERFATDPALGRVQYRMAVIDANGRDTGERKPSPHLPLLQGDLRRHVLRFPDDLPWLPTSGNAYRAETLARFMPIPEHEFPILADFYLSSLSALYAPIATLAEVCARYRVHGTNQYERSGQQLNLRQIGDTIRYWRVAHHCLYQHARLLNVPDCPSSADAIVSVAYVANRLASLKLAPREHPIRSDTSRQLLALGWAAAGRRFDVSATMRILFRLWFLAVALAPAGLARPLLNGFFLPKRRGRMNAFLGRQHRRVTA